MRRLRTAVCCILALVAGACGGTSTSDAGSAQPVVDAGTVDKAAQCAALCEGDAAMPPAGILCFGSELTNGFGRIDGTILAVQRPVDTACEIPNSDHLVLQVRMHDAAYRLVVNIISDGRNGTDIRARFADVAAALPAPAWAEGWHLDAPLDYVTTLGVHTDAFAPFGMNQLIDQVYPRLEVGARVSVYGTSNGRPNSAHLIHRNAAGADGAIVVNADSAAPRFLLFHFDGQAF